MKIEHRSASVQMHNSRPTLMIDGAPELPFFYALPDVPGGRWSWEEQPRHNIEAFARAGFTLFQLDLFLDHLWPSPAEINIDLLKRQIRGVTDVVPGASIMLRLHVNAPMWWIEAHPEECVRYDAVACEPEHAIGLTRILEADPRNALRFSLASERWENEVTDTITQVLERFAREPESRALIAVQPASGVYGEWHYWGFMRWEPDLSCCMTRRFRAWLAECYGDDEHLRIAWNDPNVTLHNATVPDTEARSLTSGVFRDPSVHRRSIDYYRCQHELVAGLVIGFCRCVKSSWPAPIATGAFYGYYFSLFNRHAAGGHLEIDRVLDSPEVDFLCGPQIYYPDDQEPGHPYRSRGMLHSVLLHGKLWLDEYDQEPLLTYPFLGGMQDNREIYRKKIAVNRACIRRSSLFAFQKGMGLWFYDFGPSGMHINPKGEYNGQLGTAGYWDNPAYLEEIAAIKRVAESRSRRPYHSSADVLVVYDPKSHYYLPSVIGQPDPISPKSIDHLTLGLYYAGVVFDVIALSDLDLVDLSSYRLMILPNAYLLEESAADRIWSRAQSARSGLLWIHAPGILAGGRLDYSRVARIVRLELERIVSTRVPGFRFDPRQSAADRSAEAPPETIDGPCDPLFAVVDDEAPPETIDGPCDPLFAVVDDEASVYARYLEGGAACLVTYRRSGVQAWFSGLPVYAPETLRAICAEVSVHRYSEGGDVAYAGSGLVTVHSKHSGVRSITLRGGQRLEIDFGPGPGTCVVDEQTGEILLAPRYE